MRNDDGRSSRIQMRMIGQTSKDGWGWSAGTLRVIFLLLTQLLAPVRGEAEIQFDVFPGYEQQVRMGGWYPVGFEVFNDGPGFLGVIEVSANQMGSQPLRIPVDLPTNTRKRIVVPSFSTSSGFMAIDARLLDEGGKVRAESLNLRTQIVAWEGFLLGSLSESFAGQPVFPEMSKVRAEYRPTVARLLPEFMPDNPVALDGLNAIYLNSRRALELKEPQVQALLAWIHFGGHVVISIDQPADVQATDWLRDLVPARAVGMTTHQLNGELHRWLTESGGPGREEFRFGMEPPGMTGLSRRGPASNDPITKLERDPAFDVAEVPVVGLEPKLNGRVVLASGDTPLMVSAARGRGLVTVLAFNPEREPLRGWKHRAWLWTRIAGVPMDLLRDDEELNIWGGRSLDSVFGAMIETRQVRKLPIELLLVLLVVYLVVIGPVDQLWLKKINKPMLTWITFPAYVALFSLLIYYIGFRLRAGNSEWNELHVVDVHSRTFDSVLRGRSFASIYSPANDTYRVSSDVSHAMLRSEFSGVWGAGGAQSGRASISALGKGFDADVYVPVWMTQMYVSDWIETGDSPLSARFEGGVLVIENPSDVPVERVLVVHKGRYLDLKALAGGARESVTVPLPGAEPVGRLMETWMPVLSSVASRRQDIFGDSSQSQIDDWSSASIATSLLGLIPNVNNSTREFVWPAGSELSAVLERGDVVVFGWLPDRLLVPSMNQFPVERNRRATLIRMVVPVPSNTIPAARVDGVDPVEGVARHLGTVQSGFSQ